MFKLAKFITNYSIIFELSFFDPAIRAAIKRQILYHCVDEKRKRKSYP